MIEFDFLKQQSHKNITQKNIHNVYFVHCNKDKQVSHFHLSPTNVKSTIIDYDGVSVSWGKMEGNVMWASPYAAEFISKPEYTVHKAMDSDAPFYKSRKKRVWNNYEDDGIPVVAVSDWDAFTQLENQDFTANYFHFFKLDKNAKILIINTFLDYQKAMEDFGYDNVYVGHPTDLLTYMELAPVLKFENIAQKYDGIYIASQLRNPKQWASEDEQFVISRALSIWDVDSLVVWNDVISQSIDIDAEQARIVIKDYHLGKNEKAFTKGIQYVQVFCDDEIIIRENNFEKSICGTLLGVKENEETISIFYQEGNYCYKAEYSSEKICDIQCLGNVKNAWPKILKSNKNLNKTLDRLELEINEHSTIYFKNKNQIIHYPATVFWANQELFAAFYMDEYCRTHFICN